MSLHLQDTWTDGHPVTLRLFNNNMNYKTTKLEEVNVPDSFKITNSTFPHCTAVVWDANTGLQWITVPCNVKMYSTIVICQQEIDPKQSLKTPYANIFAPKSLILYIDSNSIHGTYRTLESCFSHLRTRKLTEADEALLTKMNLYYNCSTHMFSKSTLLTDDVYNHVVRSLNSTMYDICTFPERIIQMCVNVIQEIVNSSNSQTFIPVKNLDGINNTCEKNNIGISGCCYSLNCSLRIYSNYSAGTHCSLNHLLNIKEQLHSYSPLSCLSIENPTRKAATSTCDSKQFMCRNGECIPDISVMDDNHDCMDGSDETVDVCYNIKNATGNRTECNTCHSDTCSCGVHYYHCKNRGCISWHKVCDDFTDCPSGDDENICYINFNHKSIASMNFYSNRHLHVRCSEHGNNSFECVHSGLCIDMERYSDGVVDCPVFYQHNDAYKTDKQFLTISYKGEDEPIENLSSICPDESLLCPHTFGNECFPFQRLCVYDKDNLGRLKFCHNGGHLLHCSMVDCSGFYKCPMSYCLPLSRVCDGSKDCPGGDDEKKCSPLPMLCAGNLRCKGSGGCVHQSHVCDGNRDCPVYGDDEWSCDTADCPPRCHCQTASLYCVSTTLVSPIDCNKFTSIKIHKVVGRYLALSHTLTVLFVSITKTGIQEISIDTMTHVLFLDLSKNQLDQVGHTFYGLKELKILNISDNGIHALTHEAFRDLAVLEVLDMSRNNIQYLGRRLFIALINIQFLNLEGNNLQEVSFETLRMEQLRIIDISHNNEIHVYWYTGPALSVFHNMSIHVVADCHVCCVLRGINCTTPFNSTCLCYGDFTGFKEIAVWTSGIMITIVSLIACILTFSAPITHVTVSQLNKNMSGLTIGIYITILAIIDNYFPIRTDALGNGAEQIVCLIAGGMQYVAIGINQSMDCIHLFSIYRVTKYWAKPVRALTKGLKMLAALVWLKLTVVVTLASMMQVLVEGRPASLGNMCSITLGISYGISDRLLKVYLMTFLVIVALLQLSFAESVLHVMKKSHKTLHAIGTPGSTKDKSALLRKRFLRLYTPSMLLTIPLFSCLCVSIVGVGIDHEVMFWLTIIRFPSTSFY